QDNEYFKDAFPDLQQTAIVVVSGQDGNAVKQTTRDLADAFTASNHYESVFAPTVHDFLEQRLLYFLPLDKLEQWLKGAEFNYGPLLRIADEADLSNVIFSLADFIQANPGLQLPVTLDSLVNSLPSDELQIQGYYPLVDQNAKQHIHLILIKGRQDFDQQLPNSEIISSIRQTIEAEAVAEGIEVHLTGEVALADEELRAGLQGIGIAASISAVLLAIIMVIGIRSTSIITAIFAMLIIGISLTLGFATLTIGSFNTLSMIFVVMFFGLGVDFAVHFSLRFQVGLRDGSVSSSLLSTSKDLLPALLLCTATSMLAFLSFAPTAYLGLAELGIISAGGLSIALFLTMTLLPAWFTQWSPANIVTRVT
ncbi:MAG: MMPL family transporter, partial [Pseudomonadota bacterium]|nr:MMPL family transporter [Pseudomonadota bacterium]